MTSLFHTPRAGDWKPNPTGRGAHAEKTGSLPEQVAYELLRGSMRLTRIADRIGENGGRIIMVMDGNNRSHRAPVLPQGAPGAYRPSGDLGVLSGRYADDAKPRAAAIAVIAGEAHCVDMSLALVRYDEIERTPEGAGETGVGPVSGHRRAGAHAVGSATHTGGHER